MLAKELDQPNTCKMKRPKGRSEQHSRGGSDRGAGGPPSMVLRWKSSWSRR